MKVAGEPVVWGNTYWTNAIKISCQLNAIKVYIFKLNMNPPFISFHLIFWYCLGKSINFIYTTTFLAIYPRHQPVQTDSGRS